MKVSAITETLSSGGEVFKVRYPRVEGLDNPKLEAAMNFGLEVRAKTKARVERSAQSKSVSLNKAKFEEFFKLAKANGAPDPARVAEEVMRIASGGTLPPLEIQDFFEYKLEDLF